MIAVIVADIVMIWISTRGGFTYNLVKVINLKYS